MATIRKHRGKFQVQVRRKGHPPVTKTFMAISDAKEWARHQERQADRGELGPDRRSLKQVALADLVTRYRDTVLPKRKGGSVEAIMLTAFLRHPICKKTLAELSTSDFAKYRDDKLAGTAGRKGVTGKTVKRLLSPIQHMFSLAIDEWDIPLTENPLAGFKMKIIDNKRRRRLSDGELDKLAEAAKVNRNRLVLPIIRFAIETAMRRGEMLALRWNDVDLERQTATIRESKNGYSRTIPLSSKAFTILDELAGDDQPKRDALIFPMAANALRLSWERLVRRAGIEDLHFHDLRHEAISRLFEIGLTVPEVASISGHRDMRMLFRYAHANLASVRAKLDR